MRTLMILTIALASNLAFAECGKSVGDVLKMTNFTSCSRGELWDTATNVEGFITGMSAARDKEEDVSARSMYTASIADAKATLALIRAEELRRGSPM